MARKSLFDLIVEENERIKHESPEESRKRAEAKVKALQDERERIREGR